MQAGCELEYAGISGPTRSLPSQPTKNQQQKLNRMHTPSRFGQGSRMAGPEDKRPRAFFNTRLGYLILVFLLYRQAVQS